MKPPKYAEQALIVIGLITLLLAYFIAPDYSLTPELLVLFVILNVLSFDALHIYSVILMPANSKIYRKWFLSKENIWISLSGLAVALAGVYLFFYIKTGYYLLFGIYLLKLLIVQHLFKQSFGFSRLFTKKNIFEKSIVHVLILLAPLVMYDKSGVMFFDISKSTVILTGLVLIVALIVNDLLNKDFKKFTATSKYIFHFLFYTSIWAGIISRMLHGLESWRWNHAFYKKAPSFSRYLFKLNIFVFLLAAIIYFVAQPKAIFNVSDEHYFYYEQLRNFHVALAFFHYWQDIWFFKSSNSPKNVIYENLIEDYEKN